MHTGYIGFLGGLFRHRIVLWGLIRRDLQGRYAGSALGPLWSLAQPLAAILIYTVVFSLVFRASVPTIYKQVPYVVFLMCAYTPYQLFSDTVNRSASVLMENASLIGKVAFPSELFVISAMIVNLLTAAINFILTVVLMAVVFGLPEPEQLLWLPVFLVPLVLLSTGVGWITAAATMVLRDLLHIVPIVVQFLFFASPIFYSFEMIEQAGKSYPILQWLSYANPMYTILVGTRTAIIGKSFFLNPWLVAYVYGLAVIIFLLGAAVFRGLKRELADIV